MYRTSADPNTTEVVHTMSVVTSAGKHRVGILAALAIMCAVMLGVTVFAGAPREVEGKEWTMVVGTILFAVPAALVHRRRVRTLEIVRHGSALHLRADGVELTFPLTLQGTQVTMYMNGVPVHEVYLQLSDAEKRGIVLGETRGAIHGKVEGWYTAGVDPSVRAAKSFEVRSVGALKKLRDVVERWNARVAEEA